MKISLKVSNKDYICTRSIKPTTIHIMNATTNNTNQDSNFDAQLNNIFSGYSDPANAYLVDELLDKYGLNWKVNKRPLQLDGIDTDYFGIQREDTKKVFSTCKEGYIPFQNTELAEMLIRISEKTGYEAKGGGSFNGGAKVFIQLNSPNKLNLIGQNNDSVNGFLTALNSHDGSTSLKWGETNITISCQNTFFACMKELKQNAKHTKSLHDKVEQAIRTLSGIVMQEKSLFDKYIELSEISVSKQLIANLVKSITEVDILDVNYKDNSSTYAINRTQDLLSSIAQETNQKGQTLWGLFSGVTQYTTHKLPVPNRDNARLESIYTGSALSINQNAFELIANSY